MHLYTYLALGDSYTIGESLILPHSFPYQVVQKMRKAGAHMAAPEIIAKTGWTTDELSTALQDYQLLGKYDFVTLLIGVNNQYRGRDAAEYKLEFENLLKQAISYANDKKEHVAVISIPDYAYTPFSADRDRELISKEIDVYNGINRAVSIQYKVHYIDITPDSRQLDEHPDWVAQDGLHPAFPVYSGWADKVSSVFSTLLK